MGLHGHVAEAQQPPFAAAVPQGAPMSFADLIEHVSPSVVSIYASGTVEVDERTIPMPNIPPQFREFFDPFRGGEGAPEPRERRSQGSGFFISAEGYVVTNNHVIDGANEITVALSDGREFEATLIGTDPATDLAVLKVEGEDAFPFVEFDRDPHVRVGDWVIAVGNPYGLSGTATAGIISAIGRPIGNQTYTDFLQIDAPINRGNSGGPTFDIHGNVVGVNSQIFSPTGGNVGIGFAIPSDLAARIADQLIANGEVQRGWLGVSIQTLTEDLAEGLGVDKDLSGVLVADVVEGSPAQEAGLQPNDVVTKFNGDEIEDARDLTRRVGEVAPGDRIRLTVLRDGREETVRVTIAQRKDDTASENTNQPNLDPGQVSMFGMVLEPANDAARERFNLDDQVGLVVSAVDRGSEAANKGIRPGDLIVEATGRDVASAADFREAVQAARDNGRRALLVRVVSQGGVRYAALEFQDEE